MREHAVWEKNELYNTLFYQKQVHQHPYQPA